MNEPLVVLAGSAAPTLMVFIGILMNRSDSNRIDARITALEISLRSEMADLTQSLRGEMADLSASLRGEMAALATNLRGEMAGLATSLRSEIGAIRGEIAAIRSEMVVIRTQAHSDTMMLMGINNEIDKRVSKFEDSRNNE